MKSLIAALALTLPAAAQVGRTVTYPCTPEPWMHVLVIESCAGEAVSINKFDTLWPCEGVAVVNVPFEWLVYKIRFMTVTLCEDGSTRITSWDEWGNPCP